MPENILPVVITPVIVKVVEQECFSRLANITEYIMLYLFYDNTKAYRLRPWKITITHNMRYKFYTLMKYTENLKHPY